MPEEKLDIVVSLRDLASAQLTKVGTAVKGFGSRLTGAFSSATRAVFSLKGALAGLGVALTAKGVFDLIKGTADLGEKYDTLSKKLGVSVETLSELDFAAGQAGTTLDDVASSLKFLQKAIAEFATTGKGPIQETIGVLGPGIANLARQGAPAEEVLSALSAEFKNLDAAQRVLVASKLFSKGGPEIIPLLTENISELRLEAQRLGLTVSGEAAAGAESFGDALDRLGKSFEGIRRQAILPILPEITKLLNEAATAISENRPTILRFFADVVEGAGEFGKSLANTAISLDASFGAITKVGTRIEIIKKTIDFLAGKGVQKVGEQIFGPEAVKRVGRDAERALRDASELSDELFEGTDQRAAAIRKASEASATAAKSAAERIRAIADALDFVGPRLEDAFATYGPTLEQLGLAEDAVTLLEDQKRATMEVSREETERRRKARQDAQDELRDRAEEIYFLEGLKGAVRDLGEEYQRAGAAARQALNSIAQATAGGATDALLDYAEGTKKAKAAFRDATRSILRDIARIIVQTLILKAIQGAASGLGGLFGGGAGVNQIDVGSGLQNVGSSRGNVFSGSRVIPFDRGGTLLRRPVAFGLEGGVGTAAEKDIEAIVPLRRNSRGELGVVAAGGAAGPSQSVVVHYYSSAVSKDEEARQIERNANIICQIVSQKMAQSAAFRDSLRVA